MYIQGELLYGQYCDMSDRYYIVHRETPCTVSVGRIADAVYKPYSSYTFHGKPIRLKKKGGALYSGGTGYVVRWTGDRESSWRKIVEAQRLGRKKIAPPIDDIPWDSHIYSVGDVWMTTDEEKRTYTIVKVSERQAVVQQLDPSKELPLRHKVKKGLSADSTRILHSKRVGVLVRSESS